jgi:hypothetical protein
MNTIKKLIAGLFKAVLLILIILILTPVLYFAWRATQPMDLPQLKGMSYDQFIEMHKICEDYLLNRYQIQHVETPLSSQQVTQYRITDSMPRAELFLLSGYATLGYLFDLDPEQPWVSGLHLDNLQNNLRQNWPWLTPGSVTWLNFLPSWWKMSEAAIWHGYQTSDFSHEPAACGRPLTPEEFIAVKNSWETAKTIP